MDEPAAIAFDVDLTVLAAHEGDAAVRAGAQAIVGARGIRRRGRRRQF
jgi:hypothetical protein